MRPGPSPTISTAPAISSFPSWLRPRPPAGGSFRVRCLFQQAGQRVALRIDHRAPELGAKEPGRLVGPEAELLPQLHGRDAVGMCRHQVGGPEPDMQRQLAAMDDGARGYRGLLGTLGALERPGLGFQGPSPVVAAGRAAEPLRPADGEQVLGTGAVIGEAALKRDQGTRISRAWRRSSKTMFELCSCRAIVRLSSRSCGTGP